MSIEGHRHRMHQTCMINWGRFPMHDTAWRTDDVSSKHLPNALMAHTYSQNGDALRAKLLDDLNWHLLNNQAKIRKIHYILQNDLCRGVQTSREIPESSGRPGPGDTRIPAGFICLISSTVFSSFLYTMYLSSIQANSDKIQQKALEIASKSQIVSALRSNSSDKHEHRIPTCIQGCPSTAPKAEKNTAVRNDSKASVAISTLSAKDHGQHRIPGTDYR